MENIRHIKKLLAKEEYETISKNTGYSVDYIQSCLAHRRNNKLIVQAAQQLAQAV